MIATVEAGNGLNADQHELRITAQNTTLIVVYNPVSFRPVAFWWRTTGSVVDEIVREIDIATGRVLFARHGLDHVGTAESQAPLPVAIARYDYFHINAIRVDEDRNLLISDGNTWTIQQGGPANGPCAGQPFVRVIAEGRSGDELGRSEVTAVTP